ncbi:two component transcriptional regulator, LuxR family [Fodinibius roseus]|uniref:Two component transcriptional regulator, LuxR family n=1 Tax=Fodinibius roseus TaxID=1194090 RepID=A0A1M4TIB1_9BACT|nr:response regulator transcription factor [Fodinibius roseus]SHE44242.1 two component transcriptional regulator, LuxR family [Fodinibius roseus]
MINTVIADDHPLMREGVKKVIDNEMGIQVVGESSDGRELLSKLEASPLPDIVILDITMPGKSGMDLIKDIKNLYPSLPILILSIHPEERFAIRALKAGAEGYLCKSSISKKLVKAIKKIVIEKRKYITEDVAEQLALQVDQSRPNGQPLHESLSDREFEVLCMIAAGKGVAEIANELSLSPHTVHTYRSRIKEKMNLATNVEMTRYAIANDLIQ